MCVCMPVHPALADRLTQSSHNYPQTHTRQQQQRRAWNTIGPSPCTRPSASSATGTTTSALPASYYSYPLAPAIECRVGFFVGPEPGQVSRLFVSLSFVSTPASVGH